MEAWADTATWSVAYVRDVRKLLAMVRRERGAVIQCRGLITDLVGALTQGVKMLDAMGEANEATTVLRWMREAIIRAELPSAPEKS